MKLLFQRSASRTSTGACGAEAAVEDYVAYCERSPKQHDDALLVYIMLRSHYDALHPACMMHCILHAGCMA